MNSAGCYKTTNNKYFNCPPRMSDGRQFTDYRPTCDVNNLIASNNNLVSSYDYRQYLIQNADKLMDINRAYTVQMSSCGPCVQPYNQGTMLPEQTKTSCDGNVCKNSLNVLNGLGVGRTYTDTDCGAQWNWPKNVPYSCCGQPVDLFNYYNSKEFKDTNKDYPRFATPEGGKVLTGGDPTPYGAS
jgi:hypothetical protein